MAAGRMVFRARMLDFLLTTKYSLGKSAAVSATGRSTTVNGQECASYAVNRYEDSRIRTSRQINLPAAPPYEVLPQILRGPPVG